MFAWLVNLWRKPAPEPDSDYPGDCELPEDLDCPRTQPTSPGLLDEGEPK